MGIELTQDECDMIVLAIEKAESGHAGEIRLHIEASSKQQTALSRARDLFGQLGMQRTRDDTGVLLYVATLDRKSAVYAGAGIHAAAEPGFWQGVSDAVATGYREERPARGLLRAVARIGELLREHAASDDCAGNELPNTISRS